MIYLGIAIGIGIGHLICHYTSVLPLMRTITKFKRDGFRLDLPMPEKPQSRESYTPRED